MNKELNAFVSMSINELHDWLKEIFTNDVICF